MEEQEVVQPFKPKMRVTLLNKQGTPVQDRLVEAYPELTAGPKIQHNGPIRLEITLTHKQDIDSFKEYIDRLSGILPIKAISAGRGRPALEASKEIATPREEILGEIKKMAAEGKDQTEVIKYLRKLGFVFILTEDFLYHFKDFEFDSTDTGDPTDNHQFPKSLAWMVRCIRRGKDPRTDKFDPMIIFGFNIQKPSRKVVPYIFKERQEPMKIEKAKKVLSFDTVEFTKFPPYMQEDERLKFSIEQRQLLLNPEKKASKFFLRWAPDVLLPNKVYEKFQEREKKIVFKNRFKNTKLIAQETT